MATECTMYRNAIGVPYSTPEEADVSDEQRSLAEFLLSASIAGVDQSNAAALASALLSSYTMTAILGA